MTPGKAQRGFTLIEMLAATVLLAVVLGILLPVFGLSARWLTQDEKRSRMAFVANSLIDEKALSGLEPGVTQGVRDGVAWELECEDVISNAGATLFLLHLRLRDGDVVEQFSTAQLQPLKKPSRP